MALAFEIVADTRCRVGESPVYDEAADALYFVDILSRRLYRLALGDGALRHWSFDREVACLGLTQSERLVVALRDRVVLFDPERGSEELLCEIEPGNPAVRLNDGKIGPDGALWVGSMDDRPRKEAIGALYRVDPTGAVARAAEGVTIANGLAWTADGTTMTFADSRGPWIDCWRFDPAGGGLSQRRRLATLDDATGRPDGGAFDCDGFYWSAGVSAGRLNRFRLDGTLVEAHEIPVPAPTMPCFGGRDYRTLFLTSLREGRPPEVLARKPLSGGVFAAPAPVAGVPPWRFGRG